MIPIDRGQGLIPASLRQEKGRRVGLRAAHAHSPGREGVQIIEMRSLLRVRPSCRQLCALLVKAAGDTDLIARRMPSSGLAVKHRNYQRMSRLVRHRRAARRTKGHKCSTDFPFM